MYLIYEVPNELQLPASIGICLSGSIRNRAASDIYATLLYQILMVVTVPRVVRYILECKFDCQI